MARFQDLKISSGAGTAKSLLICYCDIFVRRDKVCWVSIITEA